ncbi:outer membrane protein [Chelativorans sp. AA-79]|uniref:outer membrane protein n=1 Tax=Chelativorans sp. AA-79 TaxID=3028735 RepID=UPI0023F7E552|nr:outer membrane protein [Chelativorans sp. AA-79]WEX10005.1 porin family protein [Chelativorans sp. AA-79]
MLKMTKPIFTAAALAFTTSAYAADLYVPPVEAPPPPQIIEQPVAVGGWYLRGDIGYRWSELRGTEYILYTDPPDTGEFASTDLDGAMSLGGGIGYQVTRHFRTDLTADYWFDSDFRGTTHGYCGAVPCSSRDSTSYSALLLMANAYVDLGTYRGITPYVGAGIGGAYVKWDDLHNTIGDDTWIHKGAKEWRFAWSLMAGASYCLTQNLQLDAGYRFTRIEGGRMFEEFSPSGASIGAGPGFDDGFNVHEARAGLRYSFGGANANCAAPQVVSYEPPYVPPAEPVIYK